MDSNLLTLLAYTTLGSVAGLIGGAIIFIKDSWARVLCKYAVPFAAGVLLSVSLLHLLPEAEHGIGEKAFLIVLLALLSSFFFEEYFAHLHHHEHKQRTKIKGSVPLVLFGDTIHNFIDGVAIAAAYLTNPAFGLIVAFASFLHETPHEIGDFGILVAAGWKKSKALFVNFLSALSTFPGALWVYFTFKGEDIHHNSGIGILLAVSAGVFLYLGASDFLPEVGDGHPEIKRWKEFLLLLLGVFIMYVLVIFTPEH